MLKPATDLALQLNVIATCKLITACAVELQWCFQWCHIEEPQQVLQLGVRFIKKSHVTNSVPHRTADEDRECLKGEL